MQSKAYHGFEFQRSVLVDGEWVMRSAYVYHVMARNQDEEPATVEGLQQVDVRIPAMCTSHSKQWQQQ